MQLIMCVPVHCSKLAIAVILTVSIGQLQVLATDEFWPAQGGKAPEISQVREALDAILSSASQREQLN